MKLYIAGGCGEHGRNCFYVQGERICFLADCGIMAGEAGGGYPHLSRAQIDSLDCVFLTHSHADHVGALLWLTEHGFHGAVIASKETLAQLSFAPESGVELEEIAPNGKGNYHGITVCWGRSGHCVGSVWYHFTADGKTIMFSGDYTENTMLYQTDRLEKQSADLAVLDCAYGADTYDYAAYCEALVDSTAALKKRYGVVLFPVPKYGRGMELRRLFGSALSQTACYGDALFLKNISGISEKHFWYSTADQKSMKTALYEGQSDGIVFVSDPQLCTTAARTIADAVLTKGGYAVMTGTVERGSYSEQLIRQGRMIALRYPVHLNQMQYQALAAQNRFKQYIPFHSEEFAIQSPIIF